MRRIRHALWSLCELLIIGLTLVLIGLASFILAVDPNSIRDDS